MLHPVYLFLNIGTPELILILGVALLLFGGNKLPELARGLGKGIREFKDASEGVKREIHNQINSFDEVKINQEPTTNAATTTTTAAVPDVSPLDQPEITPRPTVYPSENHPHSNSTEIN
ncbi:Sec-independent protein translocase subunit TatA/TatB [Mucilaginibacter arboris]|uniref:Sec-independent protein translocase protein TatA n=1 Tax=Mucilaginibacter arboris TaxID=2682090 RepID=A0A7K1SRL4_9SPHI|nr:twin-arginine translocase TatA/TatE family subunit [Mucilaginibacter arboris]MVN19968.1 twin-arginine translocase TatA/TatE family subunit [Mucilaginibacter arboris]